MRVLDHQSGKKPRDQQSNYQDAADVYDFATLRDELGHDDKEDDLDDGLGDQLIEEGDDNNNLTFDDAPIGKQKHIRREYPDKKVLKIYMLYTRL
jgi:DNA topoisomerase 2-associated protein PAT1